MSHAEGHDETEESGLRQREAGLRPEEARMVLIAARLGQAEAVEGTVLYPG